MSSALLGTMAALRPAPVARRLVPARTSLATRGICSSSINHLTVSRPRAAKTAPPGGNSNDNDNDNGNGNGNSRKFHTDDQADPELSSSELRQAAIRAMQKREASQPWSKQEILSRPSKFKPKTPQRKESIEDEPLTELDYKLYKAGLHPHDPRTIPDPNVTPEGEPLHESEAYLSEEDKKIRAEWREYWRQQSLRYLRRLHRLEERRMADAMGFKSIEEARAAGFKYSDAAQGRGTAELPPNPTPQRWQRILHAGAIACGVVAVVYMGLFYDWGPDEHIYSPIRRAVGVDTRPPQHPADYGTPDTPLTEEEMQLSETSLWEYWKSKIRNIQGGPKIRKPPTWEEQVEAAGTSFSGTPYSAEEMAKIQERLTEQQASASWKDAPPNVYLLGDEDDPTAPDELFELQQIEKEAKEAKAQEERQGQSWFSRVTPFSSGSGSTQPQQ